MRKLRVVLVDDEIMIREGFKKLFDWGAHDCEVVGEAADGVEALGVIDSLVPDIVIMDINIPIMNGLKVIQTSRLKYPDMAFIVVSGYDDFSYCREALRLQITDYILKPVDYEEFGNTIDHLKISIFEKQTKDVSQLFKNEIGVNFLAYLTTIRMECAKKLLVSTQLSIAEISERCGYADYRVFTKVFKKTEGSTPSQYRRDFL